MSGNDEAAMREANPTMTKGARGQCTNRWSGQPAQYGKMDSDPAPAHTPTD